ncbi:hypothetical protein [Desulfobotulus mexicanus]|nr:hypothetical protein [Desulfobotulus mexicanus]
MNESTLKVNKHRAAQYFHGSDPVFTGPNKESRFQIPRERYD